MVRKKDPAAVALGRKSGKLKTPAQQAARRANMAKARAHRWLNKARLLSGQ